MSIERVGVVGAGQMGSGIAEVSAKAGANVVVYEPSEELVEAGRKRITGSLERAASKGKLSESDRDATLERLTFTTSLAEVTAENGCFVSRIQRLGVDIPLQGDVDVQAGDVVHVTGPASRVEEVGRRHGAQAALAT